MNMSDYTTGIQHLGIPTGDLTASKMFYTRFGFRVVHRGFVAEKNQHAVFMQMHDLMLELYEDVPTLRDGAVNHFAIDCSDIDSAYAWAEQQGYTMLTDGICSLDFWEKGIRYFILEGPSKERIELCQRLR